MAEAGVDIASQTSKGIDPDEVAKADLVVTLCGDARDHCPVTPPHVKRLHWPIEDPILAGGSEEEKLAVFRRVRDEIRRRIEILLREQHEA
jgi:arsenate reductase